MLDLTVFIVEIIQMIAIINMQFLEYESMRPHPTNRCLKEVFCGSFLGHIIE